jgi:glycosyltransferase involved in cell wall biosynthesis
VDKASILVTFDSMKHSNSGFFYFGKSLGDALLEQNKNHFDLTYYLSKNATYQFDDKVDKEFLSPFHKLYFPSSRKYHLVHFTDQYCRLRPKTVDAKRILTIHDFNHVHEGRKPAKKVEKFLANLRQYISLCDYVVAISNFVANDIATYMPEAKDKIRVIYNGADKLVLPEHHVPKYVPKKPFIFTIGYVVAKKNFHVLPALLKGNDLMLVISGKESAYRDTIMEEAKKYNCEDRVVITGPISEADKAWYYKNCEAFALPSKTEGFGLPVIEAMHFGKPVFLSNLTSLPEIGGDAAYYFDSFEPEAMRQAFNAGMDDFSKNDRASKVMTHARQFDWNNSAQQYLALYRECLGLA